MNDIWLSYVLMACVPIFWITNLVGYSMAKKLYRKLYPRAFASVFIKQGFKFVERGIS